MFRFQIFVSQNLCTSKDSQARTTMHAMQQLHTLVPLLEMIPSPSSILATSTSFAAALATVNSVRRST